MKKYHLLIAYTNGVDKVFYFDSRKEAYEFVVNEGDHVEDYWINQIKSCKNER